MEETYVNENVMGGNPPKVLVLLLGQKPIAASSGLRLDKKKKEDCVTGHVSTRRVLVWV